MSQENVEIVLDQYAATNERDFERVMSHYAEDVELVAREPWTIQSGRFKGREAVGRWFGDWFATFGRDARFDVPGGAWAADGCGSDRRGPPCAWPRERC